MRRKTLPLDKMEVQDPEAKGKVSLVLQVLSGEKTISEACRETGLKPMSYYKLEERMVQAMVATAKMPPRRGKRRDPVTEATTLATQTEELRQEHRRMQSLVRITKKLFRQGTRRMRKSPLGSPKETMAAELPATPPAMGRRPGRPPQVTQAAM